MSGPRPHLAEYRALKPFKGKTHKNTHWSKKRAGKNYLIPKLAKEIATGDSVSFREAALKVGYAKTYINHHANKIKNSQALQQELARIGFTEEAAKEKLSSIMNSPTVSEMITPENQLRAIDMAFKVFGTYAPDRHVEVKATLAEIIEAARKNLEQPPKE